jgi:TPR repeat protein
MKSSLRAIIGAVLVGTTLVQPLQAAEPTDINQRCVYFYNLGDFYNSWVACKLAAGLFISSDDPQMEYVLGLLYENDYSGEKQKEYIENCEKAENKYRRAMQFGSSEAKPRLISMSIKLGRAFQNGEEIFFIPKGGALKIDRDIDASIAWYGKAVELGSDEAKYLLEAAQYDAGKKYLNGEGVPKDFQKAVDLFSKSSAFGNSQAQVALAEMYFVGQGVDRDYHEAFNWYQKAATSGNEVAEFTLGKMYFDGVGVEQDYHQAIEWFGLPNLQSNANVAPYLRKSKFKYGKLLIDRNGSAQEIQQAVSLIRNAAESGDAEAQYELSNLYARGFGVDQDYVIAQGWLAKAVEQGAGTREELIRLNGLASEAIKVRQIKEAETKATEERNAEKEKQRLLSEHARLKKEAEKQEQIAAAERRRQKEEIEAYRQDVKSGRRKVQSIRDGEIAYETNDGLGLMFSPLLKPNGKYYEVRVLLDGKESESALRGVYAQTAYCTILTDQNTMYTGDELRINGVINFIGQYVQNVEYTTISRQVKTMPVFKAVVIHGGL